MANKPWVTPSEIREYSDYEDVGQRSDIKLKFDIVRAENYIIQYTNNQFNSVELPENIHVAVVLLSEYYAHLNHRASAGSIRKEEFDDYSYIADIRQIELSDLGLEVLLADHKIM